MPRRIYKGQHIAASGTEVLRDGVLAVDLATNSLYIHDGSTPGGVLLSGGAANTGEWTFTAEGGYNARTDADIIIQAVGSGTSAGVFWNLDPDDVSASNSVLVVQSDGLRVSNFDGTNPSYELTFDQTGLLSIPGSMVMDGNITGVARLQPENNSMTEILMPVDADANTTPLTLYAEGAAGIKIEGRLRGAVDSVTAVPTPPTLDLLTPIVRLNYTGADQSYILPNGTFDGQMVYFVAIPSGTTYYHWSVNLQGNYRTVDGDSETVITVGTLWYPWGETFFDGSTNQPVDYNHESHVAYAIWAGSAWNVSRGTVNLS